MIDLKNRKWNFSREEEFAVKYLNEKGYSGKLVKQYISKTVFEITKDGVTDTFELPQGIKDIRSYMDNFEKNWNMLCELHQLRQKMEHKEQETENSDMQVITQEEFHQLKAGDTVYLLICGDYIKSTVLGSPFWNCDADDPGWEVETSNGYSDQWSIRKRINQ